jgi:hypothetical protein
MDGLNILGLGSLVTAGATDAREPSAPIVTLSPEELAKRIKAEKRAAARAMAKGREKLDREDAQYQAMVKDVSDAIRASEVEGAKWVSMAPSILAFYGSGQKGADAFEASREAFTEDAIVKGLSVADQSLWHLHMPHARSKDSLSFPNFEERRKAKNELARKVSKYWKRLLDYTYPAEKVEKVEEPATEPTKATVESVEGLTLAKYTAAIGTLLKQLQASSGIEGLNITKASEALTVALGAATTE